MASGTSPSFASVLQPFIERHELAGAVTLVADRDQFLSFEGVGYSDIATRTPMATNALFWVASQTKPITATALMMLVDAGLVNIDDPVEKYLPEFVGQQVIAEQDETHTLLVKPSQLLTVAHVLSHTGGLPFLTPVELPTIDTLCLRDAVQLYALLPLQTEPGTAYQYSNVGTNIAGRIIEVVAGQSYESFLQERLFDPLGMTDTTFWPTAPQLSRLATSYQCDEAGTGLEATTVKYLSQPLDDSRRFATPGGGLFSTATDMARFCQMILRGGEWAGQRYLSSACVQQMTSRHTAPDFTSYGFGWSVSDDSFGHGGAYATNMTIHPTRGLVTVFLVQHAGFPGEGANSHAAFLQAVLDQGAGPQE